jgi:cytochrome d ubiquinol oxidase subunit II
MLADIFFAFLALLLVLYLVTDGFDLGVGVICLWERDEKRREEMIYAIESVWHANQTWLVIAGGVLFGAFPMVYGSVLAAFYIPAMLMLFSLMLRGISLEYRAEAQNKPLFSLLFGLGSLATALTQGYLLGALLQGAPLDNGEFTGGAFDWFTPFTSLVACTVACAYVMLGGCWSGMKTSGLLRAASLIWARIGAAACVAFFIPIVALISVTAGLAHLKTALFTAGPLACFALAVAAVALLFIAAAKRRSKQAFAWAAFSVAIMAVGFAWGLYPMMAPPSLTVAEAASPAPMLKIMLGVIGALFPILLIYNGYQYHVFRGSMHSEDSQPS